MKWSMRRGTSSHRCAQRRQDDLREPQAVVEVGHEVAPLDQRAEVRVRGGDHADVDLDLARAPDPLERLVLDHAVKPGLGVAAQVGDLVEEEGAPVRLLEDAHVPLGGAGERPLLVPEEVRDEQLVLEGAAVDDLVRPVVPRARRVDEAGEQLLARSPLAADQDRARDPGELAGLLDDREKRRAPPDPGEVDRVALLVCGHGVRDDRSSPGRLEG